MRELAVINTSSSEWTVMHDAARPFAVVELSRNGTVRRVLKRYKAMQSANIAAGVFRVLEDKKAWRAQ